MAEAPSEGPSRRRARRSALGAPPPTGRVVLKEAYLAPEVGPEGRAEGQDDPGRPRHAPCPRDIAHGVYDDWSRLDPSRTPVISETMSAETGQEGGPGRGR